ncbi:hypothetical protein JHK86_050172 [Glycine max]|nr:hypothetical protein JHK86_050172 [Glycine max]
MEAFPMKDSPASPKNGTYTPSETSTLTFLMHPYSQKTFQRLEFSPNTVHPHTGSLLGFAGERVETRGYVDLMTTFGQGKFSRSLPSNIYWLTQTHHTFP